MSIKVKIDDSYVIFSDQQPRLVQNRTLIPLRGVFEKMGFTVSWTKGTGSNPKGTATLTNSNYRVIVKEGATTFTTNGVTFSHPDGVPAQIIGGRIMLPIRSVLESVGCWVDWDDSTETVTVITTDKMLDNFQNSNYLSGDPVKKATMLQMGRVMAGLGWMPTYISGVLGYIQGEGNFGIFEGAYSDYNKNLPYMKRTIDNYPDYVAEYSYKYIYNKNLSVVKNMVETLVALPKLPDGTKAGFGLGCCQWSFERTLSLVYIYLEIAGSNNNSITYAQTMQAEGLMVIRESKTNYSAIYPDWINRNKANISSENAASDAGYHFLIEYGLSTTVASASPSQKNEAVVRGNNAKAIYNAMLG